MGFKESLVGDFKLYFLVGTLLAISLLFMYVYAGNFLGLQFESLKKVNQTEIQINQTQIIARDTNNETKNQTEILVNFISGVEKNREKQNNTTNIILDKLNIALKNQAHQIKLLENESSIKIALLHGLENQTDRLLHLHNTLENLTKQNNMLLQRDSIGAKIHRNITLDLYHITNTLKRITNDTNEDVEYLNANVTQTLTQIIPKLDNITKSLDKLDSKL